MDLFTLLLVLLCSSALTGAGLLSFASIEPRVRFWPTYWAVGLITGVAIPLLGAALHKVTGLFPALQIERLSFHEQLGSINLIPTGELVQQNEFGVASFAIGSSILVGVYLFGVCLCLARLILGRSRAAHIARQSVKHLTEGGATYWRSDAAVSPFALVPMARSSKARIVVPSRFADAISDEELHFVIRHEQSHIARHDDEFGMLLRLIVAVTWISPFSHMLFARWNMSAEIQCDHAVTGHQSPEMRRVYAETLLKALHITADRVRQYPAASFSTQRLRNEKMRIHQVMNGATPIFKRYSSKLTLAVAAAGFTLVGGAAISATAGADPVSARDSSNQIVSSMVSGRLTAPFGEVFDPFKEGETRIHNGIDVAAPIGTPIYAPAGGVIREATDLYDGRAAYGRVVTLQSTDGLLTLFSHLDSYSVTVGQRVVKGEQIATVGNSGKSTGPHVHIETMRDGKRLDPMTAWSFEN